MKNFYNKLQALAKKAGIKNKAELARFVGVTKSAMQNYEKGRVPDREILETISNSFGVPVQYFYDAENKILKFDNSIPARITRAKINTPNYDELFELFLTITEHGEERDLLGVEGGLSGIANNIELRREIETIKNKGGATPRKI